MYECTPSSLLGEDGLAFRALDIPYEAVLGLEIVFARPRQLAGRGPLADLGHDIAHPRLVECGSCLLRKRLDIADGCGGWNTRATGHFLQIRIVGGRGRIADAAAAVQLV